VSPPARLAPVVLVLAGVAFAAVAAAEDVPTPDTSKRSWIS
jgi:hypothetical protein